MVVTMSVRPRNNVGGGMWLYGERGVEKVKDDGKWWEWLVGILFSTTMLTRGRIAITKKLN